MVAARGAGEPKIGEMVESGGLAVTIRKLRRKQMSEAVVVKKQAGMDER